jgi:hypothetical protein
MKLSLFATATIAGGLLACAPAFAQTSPTSANKTSVQKQHTDGGDSPSNPRAFDNSTTAQKQHTDGGDSPSNPQSLQKQPAQSYAHSAGPASDSPVTKQQ